MPEETFISIPIDDIEIESNIRTKYNEEDLTSLALSMKQYGQLEPIRVYENKSTLNYVIIFGHRRYYAAIKVDPETNKPYLRELKCIITSKPDTLDKLYLQAIENEQSESISPVDREKYIYLLKKKFNQSVKDIAKKLGKNESWIYRSLDALKIREKYKETFDEVGLSLNTNALPAFKNATEEEVKEAVNEICKYPEKKTDILNDVRIKNKKNKYYVEKKSLQKESEKALESNSKSLSENSSFNNNNDNSTFKNEQKQNFNFIEDSIFETIKLIITINKNNKEKKVTINICFSSDFMDENVENILYEKLNFFYENEGYSIVKQ
jgi:ParB/RepB/Spo0J family partition protein